MRRRYLFVAIDRAPGGSSFASLLQRQRPTAALPARFIAGCPMRIRMILTDNGKEFTDRLFGLRRAATGTHELTNSALRSTSNRLTPPKSPQERHGRAFQWSGEEVLQSHHFRSGEELERRCTAIWPITRNFRNQPWAARRPAGDEEMAHSSQRCSKNDHTSSRDMTANFNVTPQLRTWLSLAVSTDETVTPRLQCH